ncbi:MAG TPA: HD domain-containing phosphohydrolase [Anaerolineales bacterium]|nr:HD domain-containing phosphohydrolase [Anaerolineales bacterium]HLO30412.1 HD domain-containing phosphohydrolase [Anaerolineales bacterium]
MSDSVIKERLVATILAILGICAAALSLDLAEAAVIHFQEYALVLLFAGAIILIDHYPIHLLRGTKVSLTNLPVFLSAVLLPAPLVMVATGVGLLVANLLARVERGLLPRDIVSTIGQWLFTAFLGYEIVHLTLPGWHWHASRLSLLLLCALSFLLLDFIVFSLAQSFIYNEPFLVTFKSVVQYGISLEVIQYLIGILGALAAYEDIWSVVLLIVPISITYVAFKNLKETRYETVQILEDLADTVDLRDRYTGGHSKGVAELVHEMLIHLKISGPEATLIEIAARLHDIGKIGVPDSILKKPGILFPEEISIMRTHSQKGAELIAKYKDFSRGALMIRHHHERWDGGGYPNGLKEHAIPFGARLIAVADGFDAMTSDRPYRKALSGEQALQILLDGRATQWDPSIVNAFVEMIRSQADEKSAEALSREQASSISSPGVLTSS